MVTKILAWSSFGTMLVFAGLALGVLAAWKNLGGSGPTLVWFVALPLLGISILLAVALLAWSVFGSDT